MSATISQMVCEKINMKVRLKKGSINKWCDEAYVGQKKITYNLPEMLFLQFSCHSCKSSVGKLILK
jgi:hypothetical protein